MLSRHANKCDLSILRQFPISSDHSELVLTTVAVLAETSSRLKGARQSPLAQNNGKHREPQQKESEELK